MFSRIVFAGQRRAKPEKKTRDSQDETADEIRIDEENE
jgi:hypothetical protein